MKLHDSPMLSFNRPPMAPSVGPVGNPMPLDPWLTSPISNATPMHAISGFVGSPQSLQPAYAGHGFLGGAPPGLVQGMQSMVGGRRHTSARLASMTNSPWRTTGAPVLQHSG